MAGRLRLAATGVQDEWITGEPQFSYFLMNFKKHLTGTLTLDK
jgi:hypothetical protein